MKSFLIILITLLATTCAFAIVDPDPNSMGLYFDEGADVYCVDGIAFADQVTVYLILTNPTFDLLYGWEGGIDVVGEAVVLSRNFYHMVCFPGDLDSMHVGFGSPSPTEPATPLLALQVLYMVQDLGPVDFFLHGAFPSSIDPEYPSLLLADGVLIMAGLSVDEGPTAQINGGCTVVSTERISFDRFKSLHR